MEGNNSEDAWSVFKNDFLTILYKHTPLKTFHNRGDQQPWICTEFLESTNERDDLMEKASKSESAIDLFMAHQARNRTVALKRQLKRLFFQNSIIEAEGDSAKLWKALKRLLSNCKKKESITNIMAKQIP